MLVGNWGAGPVPGQTPRVYEVDRLHPHLLLARIKLRAFSPTVKASDCVITPVWMESPAINRLQSYAVSPPSAIPIRVEFT